MTKIHRWFFSRLIIFTCESTVVFVLHLIPFLFVELNEQVLLGLNIWDKYRLNALFTLHTLAGKSEQFDLVFIYSLRFFFSLTLRGFCLRIRHKEPSLSAQKIRSAHVFIYKWNGKKIVPFLKIINCFSAKSFFFNCGHFHVPTSMWSKQMKKKIGFCVEKFVCLVLCGWKLCRLYYVVTELFGKQMMRCSYS